MKTNRIYLLALLFFAVSFFPLIVSDAVAVTYGHTI